MGRKGRERGKSWLCHPWLCGLRPQFLGFSVPQFPLCEMDMGICRPPRACMRPTHNLYYKTPFLGDRKFSRSSPSAEKRNCKSCQSWGGPWIPAPHFKNRETGARTRKWHTAFRRNAGVIYGPTLWECLKNIFSTTYFYNACPYYWFSNINDTLHIYISFYQQLPYTSF